MHPEKSKVVYCKDSNQTASYPHVSFTFLGFTFRPRVAINRQKRAFTNFLPGVSADALKRMRKEVRGWSIHRQTPGTLVELAQQYNPKIRGWWNYFGAFYRTAMRGLSQSIDQKLELWARRKYKTLSRNKQRSAGWLRKMKNETPRIFSHWPSSLKPLRRNHNSCHFPCSRLSPLGRAVSVSKRKVRLRAHLFATLMFRQVPRSLRAMTTGKEARPIAHGR
jgi:hypothetical protein